MSNVTEVNNTGNQAQFNYDTSKIFVWNNRYSSATFINNTGGALAFAPGTVVGRVAATNLIAPFDSSATDGSQIPIGVLKSNLASSADDAQTPNTNFCKAGDVVKEKLLFQGSDDLDTVVTINDGTPADTDNTRTVRDMIESLGINIVASTELTGFDNQ